MRKTFLAIAAAAAACVAWSLPAAAQTKYAPEYRLSTVVGTAFPWGKGGEIWANLVRERTKDTWGFWRRSVLNPESNVQFGEGGAGTFSDGKLYSQIKDPRHLDPAANRLARIALPHRC